MTEYEYYSAFQKWPNTNIIWLLKIIEYKYKYYSDFWNYQMQIQILLGFLNQSALGTHLKTQKGETTNKGQLIQICISSIYAQLKEVTQT